MNDFLGYLPVGVGTIFPVGLVDLATGLPITPDSNPAYRVYGQEGLVNTGNGTLLPFENGTITNATNTSPITVTFGSATTLSTGTCLWIKGVLGNTNANGLHVITVVDSTHASLDANGNAGYISGGLWQTAGLYSLDLTVGTVPSLVAALEEGQNYTVDVTWTQSSSPRTLTMTFTVG